LSPTTLTLSGQGGSDWIILDHTFGNPLPHLVSLTGQFTLNGVPRRRSTAPRPTSAAAQHRRETSLRSEAKGE
jgi:hypothetical protein